MVLHDGNLRLSEPIPLTAERYTLLLAVSSGKPPPQLTVLTSPYTAGSSLDVLIIN
jgi:hypothetical protein